MDVDEARARAESVFRNEKQAPGGSQAWLEHEAQTLAMREKTARLRALRLAREAANKEAGS